MITKILTYNTKQEVREVEVYNGANDYVEDYNYYCRSKYYSVALHDTYFEVFDKDRLVCKYYLLEESIEDYAKL